MALLQNTADVLRCFTADCAELTVSDVAQRLGLPKANASRLLKGMREAGLLETIGTSKRHRPGRLFLNIAAAFRSSSLLIGMGSDAVARVSRACGHTAYVSVLDRADVMAVTDHHGHNALRVVSSMGRRLPAHAAATGRCLLARLPDAEVAARFPADPGPVVPGRPHTLAELIARLDAIRARGWDHSSDVASVGVDALAVAVGAPQQGEAVSLCVVFPGAVVGTAERRTILSRLIDEAAAIARVTADSAFHAEVTDIAGVTA